MLGEDAEVLDRFPGSDLVGRTYEGPVFALEDREQGGFPVLAGDFVTTDDGTGIVHIAPAFGEDDYALAAENGIFDPTEHGTLYNPVALDGRFDRRVSGFEGRLVKDPNVTLELIADLARRGRLFREQVYEHAYPHCWRCGTPLLYYAKSSWYVATSQAREELLSDNEEIGWRPEHIKQGRFGKWLENNVDWALSRDRYWGTPLPIWGLRRPRAATSASRRLGRRAARASPRRGPRGPASALHRRGRRSTARRAGGRCGGSTR